MDPATAALNAFAALLKFLTVIAEGQPEDVRRELWQLYLKDLKWWRSKLKIDDEAPS